MKEVLAIVGPTAVGKSALAMELARSLNGEIVGADSRQVYRHMDIGTAKPSLKDRAAVPHHVIDVVDPDEEFNLALYLDMARDALEAIHRKGKLPIVVGGTGLYIWGLLEGLRPPQVPPNKELREHLEARASKGGGDALYKELKKVDPKAAKKIDPHNIRRMIRALEVYMTTGIPFSRLYRKGGSPYRYTMVGLTARREELYSRIDRRVDKMIRRGLVKEVQRLTNRGYGLELPSMSTIGYKEIGLYIKGEVELDSAVQRIKQETHRFARHQYGWFRLKDERVHWFDIEEDCLEAIFDLVQRSLKASAA